MSLADSASDPITFYPPEEKSPRRSGERWTPDRVEELKRLAADRLTTTLIAKRLSKFAGESFTRNMIIGKARRLRISLSGLKTYETKIAKPKPKLKVVRPVIVKAKPPTPPTPPSLAEVVANPKRLSILDIRQGQCYWPTNLEGVTLFCGHATEHGDSWCPVHKKLGYVPPYQRWR